MTRYLHEELFTITTTKRRKNSNFNPVHWQQARSKGTETSAGGKNGATGYTPECLTEVVESQPK